MFERFFEFLYRSEFFPVDEGRNFASQLHFQNLQRVSGYSHWGCCESFFKEGVEGIASSIRRTMESE